MRATLLLAGTAAAISDAKAQSCEQLGAAYVAACSSLSTSGACPAGCMPAFNQFNNECSNTSWNETVNQTFPNLLSTAFGHPTSHDVYESWGMTPDQNLSSNVAGYVRFTTLVNHLASRCQWSGYFGTCAYSYPLALEAALAPGEALGYNCTMTASRQDCSGECYGLLEMAFDHCDEDDYYVNMQGINATYTAMMYVLELHYSCSHGVGFQCTPASLGRAFCETLHEVADSSLGYLLSFGCTYTLSEVGPLVTTFSDVLAMPYRGVQCLSELGSDDATSGVVVQDICYCSDNRCPYDTRDEAPDCNAGVHTSASASTDTSTDAPPAPVTENSALVAVLPTIPFALVLVGNSL